MTQAQAKDGFSKTHDGQLVYPAGYSLPSWAHGWTQCDNNGGGYSTWLEKSDQALAAQDLKEIEEAANKLRTRVQCEAAFKDMGLQPGGTCKSMRLTYMIHAYRDLWPLRQVSR